MKKAIYITLGLFIFILSSCSFETDSVGPAGRDGFDGRDGRDGIDGRDGLDGKDGEEAYVFEYDVDFAAPDYRVILEFPSKFEMLESDVALVYLLWEVIDGQEIWRLVPQNIFMSEGLLQYNFDFTRKDASVFIDADYPLSLVPSNFLTGWVAKVVVIPGQFQNFRSADRMVDHGDFDAVIKHYGLKHEKKYYPDFTRQKQ